MVCECIEIKNFLDKIPLLRRILSEDYYFNKKAYICAYSSNEFKPKIPSMHKYFKGNEKSTSKEEEKKE